MKSLISAVTLLVLGSLLQAQDPAKPKTMSLSEQEQKILDLTNKEREKEKLPPFKISPLLLKCARAHSENMAKQGKMLHTLDGKTPAQRVAGAGYRYALVAENIGMAEDAPIGLLMDAWMKSPNHRTNILNKNYVEIGVGYAKDEKGAFYCTQVFARPK